MKQIIEVSKIKYIKGFFFELDNGETIQLQRIGKNYILEVCNDTNSIIYCEKIELKELKDTLYYILTTRLD